MDIGSLPTILDVVDQISSLENQLVLPHISQVPSPDIYDEGRFAYVSESGDRSIQHLMPTSQSPFIFYRGQSRYYPVCIPTLYRGNNRDTSIIEEDILCNRLRICELALLLSAHPVLMEVGQNTFVNHVTLAQHYGLPTEYLDLTNSKWVAAFFACTSYNYDTDTYHPVGRDYYEGYGVMYISNTLGDVNMRKAFFDKIDVIGYQYFDRPTRQSSFGYRLDKGQNFNDSPFFEKVLFRHDKEASEIVFNMAYRQNRFIPRDSLSMLARKVAESKEVSRAALNLCWGYYYQDKAPHYLDYICRKQGLEIREISSPIVQFSLEELNHEWEVWNEYGREELKSKILRTRPVTTIKLTDLNDKEDAEKVNNA